MGPEIPTGALALTHPVDAAAIAVDDVLSVRSADGARVTHRVKEVSVRHGEASLVLKGDANAVPDTEVYVVHSADRVVSSVPRLGFAASAMATGPGLLLTAGLAGALLVIVLRPHASRPPSRGRAGVACVAVLVTVAAVAQAPPVQPTSARFSDPATMTTGSFSGATLTAPGTIDCTEQGGLLSQYVDLSWTPSSAGLAHRITLESGAAVSTVSGDQAAGVSTYRLTAATAAGLLTVAGPLTVRIHALKGMSWMSATSATRIVRRTSLAGLGLDIRCS
jgi:signal peptidase